MKSLVVSGVQIKAKIKMGTQNHRDNVKPRPKQTTLCFKKTTQL